MRALVLLTLALALVAPAAGADDPAVARATVEKAIQALGGEAKLARAKTYTQKAAGKFHGPAGVVAFTGEWLVNPPGQLREVLDSEADGMKFHVVKVIAGDKGWLRVNGSVEELSKDALAADREQIYAAALTTLLPLRDKDFVLTPLGESVVGDSPAVGVKVTHPDRPEVSLFFDKEKGWLLRAEFSFKLRAATVKQEMLYEDYQDRDGLKRPRKTTVKRDGKVVVESEVSEFKPLDTADPRLFEKP